jgi:hypothetical protein
VRPSLRGSTSTKPRSSSRKARPNDLPTGPAPQTRTPRRPGSRVCRRWWTLQRTKASSE